ncbi:hypothetical protein B9T62_18475 [Paenibacillus donghaensis]|uniref:Uncharacterized protein n=1 Tax=Paenibacillus donghaensis TaxID=414771 RepID=A0A2Z2KH77_9BACL|nr:hypothetical protein B9T62_18475 [Paenibacillus donghaensis]
MINLNPTLEQIYEQLDKLYKQRRDISEKIDMLEAQKNLKLSDKYRGKYVLDRKRDWKDRPVIRY